jgi:hypothetical protein
MMASAGFEPSGMASMFERLQQSSRLNDSGGYPYLRSHPLTTERIGEARARLGTAGLNSAAPGVSSPSTALEHRAALARARVLMDTRVDSLRRWQALDGEGSAASATLVSACRRVLQRAGFQLLRDWACRCIDVPRVGHRRAGRLPWLRSPTWRPPARCRSDARGERSVALLKVESFLHRGEPARAQAILAPLTRSVGPVAAEAATTSRPVMVLAAQVALAEGRSKENGAARERGSAADLGGTLPGRCRGLVDAGPGVGTARMGTEIGACRSRVALCIGRPARGHRPPEGRPAPGSQQHHGGRFRRVLGHRFTAAFNRGAPPALTEQLGYQ